MAVRSQDQQRAGQIRTVLGSSRQSAPRLIRPLDDKVAPAALAMVWSIGDCSPRTIRSSDPAAPAVRKAIAAAVGNPPRSNVAQPMTGTTIIAARVNPRSRSIGSVLL